jgi:cyclohexyl-isocyanide hydratase
MRWLYHVLRTDQVPAPGASVAPASLASEGFVHCSFRDAVAESARLYFAGQDVRVLRIDPRRLDVPLELADTPRGPMPHVHGAIPARAVREVLTVGALANAPDDVRGTHFAFVAFAGMTLLDLIGVHDPIARIARMGFDPTARFTFASATEDAWTEHGARFDAGYVRPDLEDVDVLVVPGGVPARALATDREVVAWLKTYPRERLKASVCTGALLLGAAGFLEGRRATTHRSAIGELAQWGARPEDARVVHDRDLVTGGGVTAGIDVGLELVRLFHGAEARNAVAAQMEWRS